MNKGDSGLERKGKHDEGLLHFSLPGLLPDDRTLVVNPATRTVILFSNEAAGRARIVTQQFSPNGMRVLVPLLQAYPDYCPYDVMLTGLFPISLEEGRKHLQEAWAATMRPVPAPLSPRLRDEVWQAPERLPAAGAALYRDERNSNRATVSAARLIETKEHHVIIEQMYQKINKKASLIDRFSA